jgi:hypothetical protein
MRIYIKKLSTHLDAAQIWLINLLAVEVMEADP